MAVVVTKHPSGATVTFNRLRHSYAMSSGMTLTSVTTALNFFFPFDSDRVSKIVAEREKLSQQEVLRKWKMSAVLGQNVHAHVESIVTGQPRARFESLQGSEDQFIPVAEAAARDIMKDYDTVAVETIVACPALGISGMIDFLGRNKKTGALLVADWKTTSSKSTNFRLSSFDEPAMVPLHHLPNNKASRYAMQVLTYGYVLRHESYRDFFGKEVTDLPLEYKLIQIGPNDLGRIESEVSNVVPDDIVPRSFRHELTPDMMIELALPAATGGPRGASRR